MGYTKGPEAAANSAVMTDLDREIEYEFSLKPDGDPTLDQYVLHFEGRARVWDESLGGERTVGEIHGHRLDLASARYDDFDQGALLESVSSELSDFSQVVLGERGCILPSREEGVAEACEGIVYISELRVDSDFRGRGIGSALLKRMGGVLDVRRCLIALKAFPLAEAPGQERTPEEVARIKRFYGRHGFDHASGEFMVKDARLCEAIKKRLAMQKQRQGIE